MTRPPGDRDPTRPSDAPSDPFEAAERYRRPRTFGSGRPPSSRPRGAVAPASSSAADTVPPTVSQSSAPMILGIIGIVGWFLCGWGAIGSVILGVIGQRKAHELGQADMLPKVAWIGGLVVIALDIAGFAVWLAQH